MSKKFLSTLLAVIMVAVAIPMFAVSAAENEYYVEAGAIGSGSEDNPFGTLEEAILALNGKDGTVYIYGSYSITGFDLAEWTGMVTIAGADRGATLTLAESMSANFRGDVTLKNIALEPEPYSHINPFKKFVYDTNSDFAGMMHINSYVDALNEETETVIQRGHIQTIYFGGGYSSSLSYGVMGDATLIINGGKIDSICLSADRFKDTHTGISIGGNANIIINGGEIGEMYYYQTWQPNIMGALNIIFNNATRAPEKYTYPSDVSAEGVYTIWSEVGGKVMPTPEPGVFEITADNGKVAVINGEKVLNGKVELEPGDYGVEWVAGDQPIVETPVDEPDAIEIKLTIDSKEIIKNGVASELDVPAQIINSRTMVPLRAIFEALGATVEWDDATRTVTSEKDGTKVELTIGDANIYVDGIATELDVPAQIVDNRTLVPARAVAEAYGCEVGWDEATRTVTITK